MGRRMRWPHVEDHSFPDVPQVFAALRAGCGDSRPWIRRFYFARGESHVATLRLCWQGSAMAQVQSRIRACQTISCEHRRNTKPLCSRPAEKKDPRPAELAFRRGDPELN